MFLCLFKQQRYHNFYWLRQASIVFVGLAHSFFFCFTKQYAPLKDFVWNFLFWNLLINVDCFWTDQVIITHFFWILQLFCWSQSFDAIASIVMLCLSACWSDLTQTLLVHRFLNQHLTFQFANVHVTNCTHVFTITLLHVEDSLHRILFSYICTLQSYLQSFNFSVVTNLE